ncbi:OLC1v1024071C1 [Oldenlandia corymbosa var. corymbosa]|uniref:OLC1v1024071C1 n=1 Tax=Oldenlandia corymbosa var. corymbosa TaxID=529605 RepID=A0AAV1C3V3_OLDCO|nr:OLC1v1024071C1 [Oldenlandia corymbosa var. corymbosa]
MDQEDIKMLVRKWWDIYNDESLDYKNILTATAAPATNPLTQCKVDNGVEKWNGLREKLLATSPALSESGFDLLKRLLTYDPEKRITAEAALKHEWFFESPLPATKESMASFLALRYFGPATSFMRALHSHECRNNFLLQHLDAFKQKSPRGKEVE